MSEWQDISTAPKDGSLFVIFIPESVFGTDWNYAVVKFDRDCMVREGDGGNDFAVFDATHWQPLPPPPNPHSEKVE